MKSIFLKNFTATFAMLAIGFLTIALSFVGVGRTYLIEDYRDKMKNSVQEVSHTASAVSQTDSLSGWTLRMAISSISGASGDHIFVTDADGVIRNCSDKYPFCEHIGQVIPEEFLQEAASGSFDQLTTLDGFYPKTAMLSRNRSPAKAKERCWDTALLPRRSPTCSARGPVI